LSPNQAILFAILFLVIVCLIWGRWRYDLIAFSALIIALVVGVVPTDNAFSGFGHPATVIVALVLVVTRGLINSGVVELITNRLVDASRSLSFHVGVMSSLAAALSTVMNNVAALALLMPVDIEAAKKAKRSPALTLMPISFATMLGGMVTLIGTPPNIIIATYRGTQPGGEPFGMFDFTPVGAACAVAGVAFITLFGWRLLPAQRRKDDAPQALFEVDKYLAELEIPANSKVIGAFIGDLDKIAETQDLQILSLIRNNHRIQGESRNIEIENGDALLVQGRPEGIEKFAGTLGLLHMGADKTPDIKNRADLILTEVVVPENAIIHGQSVEALRLRSRYGVNLVGVSRRGETISNRLRQLTIKPGDILLLMGSSESLNEVSRRFGCLPLARRGLQLIHREKAGLAVLLFAGAVLLAGLGVLQLPVVLGGVVIAYAFSGIVPIREIYDHIEWPVIILLGSLIPIGQAFETTGCAALIASQLVGISRGAPPIVTLTLLMLITMLFADMINNTATAVILAPVAVDIASRLSANADPFLMAVAVASSCAFLTPIGHKNNTLILGPGGYRYGDYWRMGLPLQIIVLSISVPLILKVWPL
jgi:di/tricarboxylate transporter